MDRWSRLYVRWKVLVAVFPPLAFVVLALLTRDVRLALTVSLLFGCTAVVVYLFAEYADEAL